MLISRLHALLTPTQPKNTRSQRIFWFSLSVTLAVVYGLISLKIAFRGDYVVDSDARQHVYWMQRFLDPELFPNDLITDYHQSVAPAGYRTLYWLVAKLGIAPLVFNKLVPPILGLITTTFCFFISLEFIAVPVVGFATSLLLNQTLWMRYDLVSGTPRAFIYPLFLGFLYFLLRRKLLPTLGAIALQGLFYPQAVFVSSGVLVFQVLRWKNGRFSFSKQRQDYLFCIAGLIVAFLVMLPYALHSSEFGPAITLAEAKVAPEFQPNGRTPFFHDNFWGFWLYETRSSIFPRPEEAMPLIWMGILLPVLMRFPCRFASIRQISPKVSLLGDVTIASFLMFGVAHLLLFRLHLPSRYTMHSLPIVLSLAGGMVLIVLLNALFNWAQTSSQRRGRKQLVAWGVTLFLVIVTLLFPSWVKFPFHKYKQGDHPQLYQFFAQQPKEIAIASLTDEANYLPTFSQRSVLISPMYAIPYHTGYYQQLRQRANDLIRAQYSPDLPTLQNVIDTYNISFWLVDQSAFSADYIRDNKWLMQYDSSVSAIANLEAGKTPALVRRQNSCGVLESGNFLVLDAKCLLGDS